MIHRALARAAGLEEPPAGFWGKAALWWGTGLGSGCLPVAPGTWGTLLVGAPVWALCLAARRLEGGGAAEAGIVLVAIVAALASCQRLVGGTSRDPGGIVADEVAGFAVAAWGAGPVAAAAAFVLFRVLDIAKPWPARALERLGGGAGVAADDLAAGLYAALLWRLAASLGLLGGASG